MRRVQPPPALRALAIAALIATASACDSEIGDECTLSSDCSDQGDRFCDTTSPGGYCTVVGCDFDSCPGEAVCVRFFSVANSDRTCDARKEDIEGEDNCTADELCTLSGTCVPRNAEARFCMKKCSSDGDCRDDYECRDETLMREHGGEPVQPAGEALPDDLQGFCASKPI
jgi:hypothetical protein